MKFLSTLMVVFAVSLASLGAQEIAIWNFSKKLEGWKIDLPKACAATH